MNFYSHHLGDYSGRTSHLSLLEHGVYLRLLHLYYTREESIPADQAARLLGARSRDEKAALEVVLQEFFQLEDGRWTQARCEEELAKHRQFIERQRSAAGKRWQSTGNAAGMPSHESGNPSHSPSPNTQYPEGEKERAGAPPRRTSSGAKSKMPADFTFPAEVLQVLQQRVPEADPEWVLSKFKSHHQSAGTLSASWPDEAMKWALSEKPTQTKRTNGSDHQRVLSEGRNPINGMETLRFPERDFLR